MSTMRPDYDPRSELLALTQVLGKARAQLIAMHERMANQVLQAREALAADDMVAYDAAHDDLVPLRIEMAAQYGRMKAVLKRERQLHDMIIDAALLAMGEEVAG